MFERREERGTHIEEDRRIQCTHKKAREKEEQQTHTCMPQAAHVQAYQTECSLLAREGGRYAENQLIYRHIIEIQSSSYQEIHKYIPMLRTAT